MPEEAFIKLLSNVGVPAALCFYTLFRLNQTMRDLTTAITNWNNDTVHRLNNVESSLQKLDNSIRELRYFIELHTFKKDK